jgi:integrase
MTIYFNKARGRWAYDFVLKGVRHTSYCLDATGEPVTSRSAAKQAEGVARRKAAMAPKIADATALTLAMVMADLKPLWKAQARWHANAIAMRELLAFFGPGTPMADITEGRIQDYVIHARTQPIMSWQGGPRRDPADEDNARYWKPLDRTRAPATINLYLTMLRQCLDRASKVRDPITGKPAIDHLPKVPELPVPRRKARPIPDAILADVLAAVPQHVREAMLLTLYFGFRRGEVFSLQIHNVDFDAGGVRLFAESVKDAEDTFLPGAPEAMTFLKSLVDQARNRGHRHLIMWRRPRKDPADQAREPWLPIKKPKSAWATAMNAVEEKFGRRFRWHDIRAAFITHVAMTSGQLAAQALARHSDYDTTRAYVEVADELRRAAADRAAVRPALKSEITDGFHRRSNAKSAKIA